MKFKYKLFDKMINGGYVYKTLVEISITGVIFVIEDYLQFSNNKNQRGIGES